MASEARRQGWRVVAFTFGDTPGIAAGADLVIPSRLTEVGPVLAALEREGVSAALFSGKFWMRDVLTAEAADADPVAIAISHRAESRTDARLSAVVVATLAGMGVTVLDQRRFVAEWVADPRCWSARAPTEVEWREVRVGLRVAGVLAEHGIGQTVVVRHGVVTAVEAVEGTTEAVRRGAVLAGKGAVIVKTVAREHDYRLDLPTVGPETIEAAVEGGAAVVAFEADRVLLLERDTAVERADAVGIALVSVRRDGDRG
jgi:hypothetical protein